MIRKILKWGHLKKKTMKYFDNEVVCKLKKIGEILGLQIGG